VIDGKSYWFSAVMSMPACSKTLATPIASNSAPTAYLLPNYDEAVASYKDYGAVVDAQYANRWDSGKDIFAHYLMIDGWVIGTWKRTLRKDSVVIETKPFAVLTDAECQAIAAAAHRYGEFLGMAVVLLT
jgi:hypothetical protein